MSNYPTEGSKRQRWQAFQNKEKDAIPGFAILGPTFGDKPHEDTIEAIEGADNREPALRLGRPYNAFNGGQDAALFYVNGPQAVQPGGYGSCTQDGPMQCLVGYPKGSPPAWNDYLAIDLFDVYNRERNVPYHLVPGSGGYRFISFNGCPKTAYKDKQRPTYEFKVAWVTPAYKDNLSGGLVFRMGSGGDVVESHSVVSFGTALGPQAEWVGPADLSIVNTDQGQRDRLAGFFEMPRQGIYLLNFSACIQSPDAPISGYYPFGLRARTGRYGNNLDDTMTREQIESALSENQGAGLEGGWWSFFNNRYQALDVFIPCQPADTQLYHSEEGGVIYSRTTQEYRRHWFTVSGSMVLDVYAGDIFFFYNPSPYEIAIANFSGTLTALPGMPGTDRFQQRSIIQG